MLCYRVSHTYKMGKVPDYSTLPTEILEQVFHHLSASQLCRARLVCRAWNETICGSKALLDRFVVVYNHAGSCRKNCPDCLVWTKTGGRFHNFKVSYVSFVNWSLVADHLQRLTLHCFYGFKAEYLVDILRNLRSNLQSLTLSEIFMDDFMLHNIKLGFKMKNLTELSITNGQIPVKCLWLLKKICVRLVVLNIEDCIQWKSYSYHSDDQLYNLISAVRDTLTQLGLTYRNIRGDLLEDIASSDRLELKKLRLQKCDKLNEQHLVTLSRLQPSLECLEVKAMPFRDEMVLIEVCQNLASVTCLKLETIQLSETTWLSHVPHLVHLELNTNGSNLDLNEVTLPNLKILFLEWATLPTGSLQKLFKAAPNLHKLSLSSCNLQNAPELLASLPQANNLQHLKVEHIPNFIDRCPKLSPHQTTDLRRLELINVVPSFPLQALCQRSSKLESVHLERINIGDRQLQLSCRGLKRLKELSLQELTSVTGAFVEYICVNRRTLEKIKVTQCGKIRYAERNRLSELRERVDVFC